ncbi:DUF4160 domain-containing protein [Hymenobacter sp.]|uniref:DUF4160 domain-containing protein n=1 Tax=Hymenobacter sp. TaxID=1898978 RepID=UPI00286CC2E1|nr:DUF4160 domain-containing protein [Hymenobacter sp.]
MPTVLRIAGFRFFFYSNEGSEPPHIHVERSEEVAKFWLEPVELVSSFGFSAKEINQLRKLVTENQPRLVQSWHEYFN